VHADLLTRAAAADAGTRAATAYLLQVCLGVIWLAAGAGKLRAPVTVDQVSRLLPRPRFVIPLIAATLPWLELALGAAVISGWRRRETAGLSAVLFLAFAALTGTAMVRGTLAGGGCGCFGRKQATSHAAERGMKAAESAPRTMARNVLLAILAALLAVP
jgi:uncharacterized membrane protein YphA (DoxX/SURF4 family)